MRVVFTGIFLNHLTVLAFKSFKDVFAKHLYTTKFVRTCFELCLKSSHSILAMDLISALRFRL